MQLRLLVAQLLRDGVGVQPTRDQSRSYPHARLHAVPTMFRETALPPHRATSDDYLIQARNYPERQMLPPAICAGVNEAPRSARRSHVASRGRRRETGTIRRSRLQSLRTLQGGIAAKELSRG